MTSTTNDTHNPVRICDERDDGAFIPSFLDDFGLSPFEFRLYSHIARRAGGGSQCWEGVDKMAKHCKMERKTAYKAFQFLEDHKMIRVERRKGATSSITLTRRSLWIPPDQKVESDRPTIPDHPLKGTSKKKKAGCTENGTGLGCTENGTGGVPNMGHLPVPNTGQPPVPNTEHKGIPSEVTPSEGTPPKKRADDFLAIAALSQEKEKFLPAQTTPKIEEPPKPQSPFSPAVPENLPKKVYADPMGDHFANKGPSRQKQTAPLTRDSDFLKYLFTRLRKTKPHYRDLPDISDLEPVRGFIRKCWLLGAEGDIRFAEMENYIKDYEEHKAAEAIATQQRQADQQAEQQRFEETPSEGPAITTEYRKQFAAELRRKQLLKKLAA